MFGFGVSEIFLILAVALVFVGPKRLPELARTLGKIMAQLRRAGDEFRETIHREVYSDDGIDTFLSQDPYKNTSASASGSDNVSDTAIGSSPEEKSNEEEENQSSFDETQAGKNEQ